jgi:ethanolamine utilization protein EutQ (cupin superfamily)
MAMRTPETGSGVRLLSERDVPVEEVCSGLSVARAITEAGFTDLGGGWARMDGSGELANWTLQYDEVLYVIGGELEIECNGTPTVAGPGRAILILRGTTVTYRGRPNTTVFFVLHPRNWAERSR